MRELKYSIICFCLIMSIIIILSAAISISKEHDKSTHKYNIQIGNKEFDNCTYKSNWLTGGGEYYTENGGKIDFGKEANVILQK